MASNETQEFDEKENHYTSLHNSSQPEIPVLNKETVVLDDNVNTSDFISFCEENPQVVKKAPPPKKQVSKKTMPKKKKVVKDINILSEDDSDAKTSKSKTPPKKGSKKSAISEKNAKTTAKKPSKNNSGPTTKQEILEVIVSLNRPFSIQDLLITLKNSVTKTVLTKYLTDFTEKNQIINKTYGKTSIYCPKQEQEAISVEELENLDNEIEILQNENNQLKETFNEKSMLLGKITQYKDDKSLRNEIKETVQSITTLESRLTKIKSGGKIDEKEVNNLDMQSKKLNAQLKEIKVKFGTIVDALCDGLNCKRKELFDEVGIEL